MLQKENQQVLNLQVTDGLTVAVIQDSSFEFLMTTKDVATGYGVQKIQFVLISTKMLMNLSKMFILSTEFKF